MRPLRVEIVSEHASPLASVGGADAGGQNVHVAELAAHLAGLGCDVTVLTRADAPHLEHEGDTLYFCCDGCRSAFAHDPSRYAASL